MQRSDTAPRGSRRRAAAIAACWIAAACHGAPAGDPPRGQGPRTQAQIAASDNADGERLMRDGKFAEAGRKFELAFARDPVVAYYINDCTALLRAGDLERALHACQGARNNEPTPAQRGQIEQLIQDIVQAGKARGLELCDGCVREAPPDPPPH